jgi:hypothetical protein
LLDPVRHRHASERRHQVEGPADRGVSDGMDRRGDPSARRHPHGPGGLLFRGDGHAAVAAPHVRLEHPRGAAAEAAVEKQLDPAHPEPLGARAAPNPALDQFFQRGDRRVKEHPQAERPLSLEPLERREHRLPFHVVNAGDAQAVRLGLCLTQRGVEEGRGWLGEMWDHQLDGALEQQTGGLAGAVTHDAAAERVRRLPRDAGQRKRGAVDPGRVDVQRVEIHRAAVDRVERGPVRRERPAVGIPSLADHPALDGCGRGHAPQGVVPACRTGELDPLAAQGPHGEVGVPVHEPGRHERIGKLVDGRVCGYGAPQRHGPADLPNPAVLPPDGVPAVSWGQGEDAPGDEQTRIAAVEGIHLAGPLTKAVSTC